MFYVDLWSQVELEIHNLVYDISLKTSFSNGYSLFCHFLAIFFSFGFFSRRNEMPKKEVSRSVPRFSKVPYAWTVSWEKLWWSRCILSYFKSLKKKNLGYYNSIRLNYSYVHLKKSQKKSGFFLDFFLDIFLDNFFHSYYIKNLDFFFEFFFQFFMHKKWKKISKKISKKIWIFLDGRSYYIE